MNDLERLKGRTILIGKEPSKNPGQGGRLLIAIIGIVKPGAIGAVGSVSNSVSRCIPAEGIAHCKIVVGMDGSMTIFNMKPQNVTYVDGIEIVSKRITFNSQVALGMDRFQINIKTVIEVAIKLLPPEIPEYSIKHLEKVWNDYDQSRTNEQLAEAQRANIQKLGGICSSCGVLFMFFEKMGIFRFFLTGISVLIAIIFFIRGMNSSNSLLVKLKELDADFRKKYVCPNKDCNHFLGNIPYDVLRTNKKCSYCGCRFNEK